ncbi:MAG: polyhydroxyalkanoic acid system family protein [Burkholderiaceae bacterium]|nr:polyhydroxyalkanoic acid system family protein [Burkholderiaceae bacterium]MEB2350477.1 polyhydroxyalkanoic acid system family protein [Burkholderiaceae bacterium]
MAAIHLTRRHSLGLKKARAAAQKVADDMAESFDIDSEWDGDVLRFARAGVSGCLTVSKDRVVLEAKLGLLLAAFKLPIEERVQKGFDRYFA